MIRQLKLRACTGFPFMHNLILPLLDRKCDPFPPAACAFVVLLSPIKATVLRFVCARAEGKLVRPSPCTVTAAQAEALKGAVRKLRAGFRLCPDGREATHLVVGAERRTLKVTPICGRRK